MIDTAGVYAWNPVSERLKQHYIFSHLHFLILEEISTCIAIAAFHSIFSLTHQDPVSPAVF